MMAGYIQSPKINYGRRSRKPLGVTIRKMSNGLDDVNGYFPDSDDESVSESEITEGKNETQSEFVICDSVDDVVPMSSEEEPCTEAKMVIHHEESENEASSADDDVHDKVSHQSFHHPFEESSALPRYNDVTGQSRGFVRVNSPETRRYLSKVNESIVNAIYINDTLKTNSPTTPKRRSKVVDSSVKISKSKEQVTPRCLLLNAKDLEKEATNKNYLQNASASNSPSKSHSVKNVTEFSQNIPKRGTSTSEEESQNKVLDGEEMVNAYFDKEVFRTQTGRKCIKRKSMNKLVKDTAVSTEGLRYDDDGGNDDDSRYGRFKIDDCDDNERNMKSTRYIIIERREPKRKQNRDYKRETYKHDQIGSKKFERRKKEKQDYHREHQKASILLPYQDSSSSEYEQPEKSAKIHSKWTKGKTKQTQIRSRADFVESERRNVAISDANLESNKTRRKSTGETGEFVEEHEPKGNKRGISRIEKGNGYDLIDVKAKRKVPNNRKSSPLAVKRSKRSSVLSIHNDNEEGSLLDSGRYNRLENERGMQRRSSLKLSDLQQASWVEKNETKMVNESVSGNQRRRSKAKRKRSKIVFNPRRKKVEAENTNNPKVELTNETEDEKQTDNANEKMATLIANARTPSNFSPAYQIPSNGLETPKRRPSLAGSHLDSQWVGPSPSASPRVGTPLSTIHRSGEKRKRERSFPNAEGVNSLPGGSHSEHENEQMEQKEEIAEEEKSRIEKKKKKVKRICYQNKQKGDNKVKVGGLEISSSKYEKILNETDNKEGIRTGKRKRVKPVRSWITKERIQYERRDSGFAMKSPLVPQIENDNEVNVKENKVKKPKKSKKKESNTKKLYEDVSPSMMVRDDDDNLVNMNLIFTPAMLNLVAPGKLPDGREIHDFLLHKFFEQRLFNAGRFVLLPMSEKGHQFVKYDTLLFHVMNGEVDFVIENEERKLGPGCDFFVPSGNAYNIKNATNEEAMIFYVQIKG